MKRVPSVLPAVTLAVAIMLFVTSCMAVPAGLAPAATTTPVEAAPAPASTEAPAPTITPVLPTATALPEPTATAVPPTATASPAATASPTPSQEATPTVAVPTDTPAPTATPAPAAIVKKPSLNLRGGPGTLYDVVGAVSEGESLAVTGQAASCAWLQVTTAGGEVAWVIGGADYVTLNAACETVPVVEAPPTPTALPPTATLPAPAPTATTAPAPAEATAEPAAEPTEDEIALPDDKGCYLFINYVGAELDMTFTEKAQNIHVFFKITSMGRHVECFVPGKYTYTIDAPGWRGGGDLDVVAGEHYEFPLVGRD